jgi:hypothetical protein
VPSSLATSKPPNKNLAVSFAAADGKRTFVSGGRTQMKSKVYRALTPAETEKDANHSFRMQETNNDNPRFRPIESLAVEHKTYGLIGREAKNLLKQILLRPTAKREQPYSVVRGFVNARINLAILRVPASKMSKRVRWLDGAGLGLFETM